MKIYLDFDGTVVEHEYPKKKSIIIGLWRQGNSYELIASLMGISEKYVRFIVESYLSTL